MKGQTYPDNRIYSGHKGGDSWYYLQNVIDGGHQKRRKRDPMGGHFMNYAEFDRLKHEADASRKIIERDLGRRDERAKIAMRRKAMLQKAEAKRAIRESHPRESDGKLPEISASGWGSVRASSWICTWLDAFGRRSKVRLNFEKAASSQEAVKECRELLCVVRVIDVEPQSRGNQDEKLHTWKVAKTSD